MTMRVVAKLTGSLVRTWMSWMDSTDLRLVTLQVATADCSGAIAQARAAMSHCFRPSYPSLRPPPYFTVKPAFGLTLAAIKVR